MCSCFEAICVSLRKTTGYAPVQLRLLPIPNPPSPRGPTATPSYDASTQLIYDRFGLWLPAVNQEADLSIGVFDPLFWDSRRRSVDCFGLLELLGCREL